MTGRLTIPNGHYTDEQFWNPLIEVVCCWDFYFENSAGAQLCDKCYNVLKQPEDYKYKESHITRHKNLMKKCTNCKGPSMRYRPANTCPKCIAIFAANREDLLKYGLLVSWNLSKEDKGEVIEQAPIQNQEEEGNRDTEENIKEENIDTQVDDNDDGHNEENREQMPILVMGSVKSMNNDGQMPVLHGENNGMSDDKSHDDEMPVLSMENQEVQNNDEDRQMPVLSMEGEWEDLEENQEKFLLTEEDMDIIMEAFNEEEIRALKQYLP